MTVALRLGLAALAGTEFVLGVWTQFFPRSFYDDVATVDLTPPFSEHLMRDFGGATLGIAIVLVAATIWPDTRLVVVALLAYLAFSIPHLVFHLGHLNHASTTDAAGLTAALVASVIGPVALLGLAFARTRRIAKSGPR